MKTKDLVLASLLLALGLALHSATPAILGGVKPDFLLATLFIAILSQPRLANTAVIALAAGLLAAMTTGFPGGQIPNILDKLVTAAFVLGVVTLLKDRLNVLSVAVLGFAATFVSGFVFLGSALVLVGLPAPFSALVMAVVLPTALANTVVSALLYKAFILVRKPLRTTVTV